MYFKGGHDYPALAVRQTQHESFDIACTVITLDHLELELIGTIRRSDCLWERNQIKHKLVGDIINSPWK